jgi:hypothetical protein
MNRRIILITNILFLLALAAALAPSALASVTTCPSGAYSLYLIPNFTCQSGNLIFKNFGYSSALSNPSGIAIPASAITVTPVVTDGNEGFQFAGGWNVGTQAGPVSNVQDSVVSFDVMDMTVAITDLHLFFNGSFTGTGTTSATESYCLNHALAGCPGGSSGSINVTNPPPNFNAATSFAAVSSISISKDINATSGTNGTASISQVINQFSNSIPEPLSFVLLGSGLLGLGLLRKRVHTR